MLARGRASRAASATPPARCSSSTTGPTWPSPPGADGVHVGQDDMPVAEARAHRRARRCSSAARRTRPSRSTAARGADYVGVGPVHATPTKPGPPGRRARLRPPTRPRTRDACRGSPSAAIDATTSTRSWPPARAASRRARDRRGAGPRGRGARAARRAGRRRVGTPSAPARGAPRAPPAAAPRARPAQRGDPRATLEPLAPGERPRALIVAAVVAAVARARQPRAGSSRARRAAASGRAAARSSLRR